MPWCVAVSEPPAETSLWSCFEAWELHFGAGFLSAQKATLGSGACLLGAASVRLQCHGVLLFRNRPLGGRCGAVLRAWELHFGAGFLSAQKATLGSWTLLASCRFLSVQKPWCFALRNRPLLARCRQTVLTGQPGSCTLELVSCRLRRQR